MHVQHEKKTATSLKQRYNHIKQEKNKKKEKQRPRSGITSKPLKPSVDRGSIMCMLQKYSTLS